MRRAVLTEVVQDDGRVLADLAADLALAVEQAHGVALETVLAGLAEAVLVRQEIGLERLVILRAAGRAADGIDPQRDALDAELRQDLIRQRDDLGVRHGIGRAGHLHAELVELAQASLLRTLVTEAGEDVAHAQRQRLIEQAVLEDGADGAGRALGAEREGALLREDGIHLLLHDIGRLADAAGEKAGLFKGRDADLGEAVLLRRAAQERLEHRPALAVGRKDVLRPVGALDDLHGYYLLDGCAVICWVRICIRKSLLKLIQQTFSRI